MVFLYPLYFELVKKAAKDEPKPETAIWAAQKLVKCWGVLGAKLKAKGIELPKLHLSCDSGYSDKNLAKTCQENDLTYISVAKKSHNFEIDGKKVKLCDWVAQVYLEAEKAHQASEKDLPKEQKTAFTSRKRIYCTQINEARIRTKDGFECKLFGFAFLALQV